jgi:hypothetical protein
MRYVLSRAAELRPDEWVTATELARELYGPEPTKGELSNMRRAIGALADRGEVAAQHVIRGGHVVLAIRGAD